MIKLADRGRKVFIDYGFSCGRAWVEIDGKVIAQTTGDDFYMRNEDVQRLQEVLFGIEEPPSTEDLLAKCQEAMQEFVDRCDRGEVRSTYTYDTFKQILKETGCDTQD